MTPFRPLLAATAAASLIAAGLVAPARPAALADGGATADEVAQVLQGKGYAAQLSKDDAGDPMIRSGAEGASFTVFFYGCQKTARCSSIEFSAAYHIDGGLKLTDVNGWNLKNRFGRTYLDSENDPHVEMDLDMEHGFTTEAIANNVDTWDAVLTSFQRMVRCASDPKATGCQTT